jgi:NAD+ synthase
MQEINYQQESKKISNWIQKVFSASGMQKIVIGMSGGIDSAVSCALAVQAVGKENVIPVLLPYGSLSSEGVDDAKLVIKYLEISEEQVVVIDIQGGVDGITPPNSLLDKGGLGWVRKGNVMARVRMIYLFDLAKQHRGLVCGTENKSEHYLGYFTRFGDEASDIEPILHLYKTHVWEIGNYLGLPETIITKAPTAGLWDGQTDESELGFSYHLADQVLHYFIDEKIAEAEIIAEGLDEKIVKKVLQRVKENEFKHQLPFVYQKQ